MRQLRAVRGLFLFLLTLIVSLTLSRAWMSPTVSLRSALVGNKSLRERLRCLSLSHARSLVSNDNQRTTEEIRSVVICGPSGVGKGSLINKLLENHADRFALSVSHTSRAPRVGEIDGVHYHFVAKESLLQDIARGSCAFLEHAEVHGNVYATREDAVRSIHAQGKVCVLDVDTRGVKQLKASGFPLHTIFIAPPSVEALEARLRGRGTEREEQIRVRVNNAKQELEYGLAAGNFELIIVNDELDKAYAQLVEQLQTWFHFTR